MPFTPHETGLPGLTLIEPRAFGDARGWFVESYNRRDFENLGLRIDFVQDNMSFSGRGTVRGLHFQAPPFAQGKLVSVLQGSVVDVVVDIRVGSPTYGKSYAVELSDVNRLMLWVPPGFAHGFAVHSETALFVYKVTDFYNRESEGGVLWNDPALGIDWRVDAPILSDKDQHLPTLAEFQSPFRFTPE